MIRTLFLSSLLAVAGVGSPAQAAEPAKPTVALEVDVSALPDEEFTRYLERDLIERQVRILADGGLEVADDASATIRVIVSRHGDNDIHYRFTVALFEGDAETPKVKRTLSCELCKDSELVTKVGEEVARVSGRLLFEPEERPETQPAAPETEEPDELAPEQPETTVIAPRVGGAGWAGIASAAAGLGVGIGGAVVLAKPATRTLTMGDEGSYTFTRPRRLGSTLTIVGAGLLVTGAVLIAIDQTVLLEQRRSRARRMSLAPTFSATGLGLSWSGRF